MIKYRPTTFLPLLLSYLLLGVIPSQGAEVIAQNKEEKSARYSYKGKISKEKIKQFKAKVDKLIEDGAREYTPLHYVVKEGNIDIATFLIEKGADVNAKDNKGNSPLDLARKEGNSAMINLLMANSITNDEGNTSSIENDAEGKEQNKEGSASSIENGAEGKEGSLARYPYKGESINSHRKSVDILNLVNDFFENTSSSEEKIKQFKAKVDKLIEEGAYVDTDNYTGWLILVMVCTFNNLEVANIVLGEKANVNIKHKDGNLLFFNACRNNNLNAAIFLMRNGVDVDARDGAREYTPLHYVVKEGNIDIATLLIQYGAEVNAKDNKGNSPLDLARKEGNSAMINLLMANSITNDEGNTSSIENDAEGKEQNKEGISARYLYKGGSINLYKKNREITESIICCIRKDEEMTLKGEIEQLIKEGADINAKSNGFTALQMATMKGYKEIVTLLIENGADVNEKNDQGRTAQEMASWCNKIEINNFLVAHRASLIENDVEGKEENSARINLSIENSTTNDEGNSPLDLACKEGNSARISLSIENDAEGNVQPKEENTSSITNNGTTSAKWSFSMVIYFFFLIF